MERDKNHDVRGSGAESDMVESAGETTAAATGSTEAGAATGHTSDEGAPEAPVGADTMVKVADSTEEG